MDITIDTIIFVLEILGTIAFAVSGVLTAIEKDLDLLGVLVLGTVTAVGGGALRDILLGTTPPVLFQKPVYVFVAAGTSLLVFLYFYFSGPKVSGLQKGSAEKAFNVLDAVGLGVFVVVGVRASISRGYESNAFLTVFIGTVTGIGGGLMRDQLAGKIPMVLRKRIYALSALAGAIIYYGLYRLNVSEYLSAPCGIGTVLLLRLLATKYKWSLPHISKRT